MDSLDAAAAAQIAGWLLDERDLASLSRTSRFWRDALSDNPGLWSQLLARRFGAAAPTGRGSPSTPRGSSSSSTSTGAPGSAPGTPAAADPERRFRQLATAALRRSVASLERLIWLDGSHVQRIDDPSSPYGTTIRVANVWWLELGGRLHGVLPGRYRLMWRLRLEPGSYLGQVHLGARQERPAAWPAGDGASSSSSSGKARESVQDWEWTLQETAITASRARALAAVNPAGPLLLAQAFSVARAMQQAHQWHGWFEVASEPFELDQLCDLWVEVKETRQWKAGIVVDSVRLARQQAQQQRRPQRVGEAAEAQAAATGQEASSGSAWARLRQAARALGLPG